MESNWNLPAVSANVNLTLGGVDLVAGEGANLEPIIIYHFKNLIHLFYISIHPLHRFIQFYPFRILSYSVSSISLSSFFPLCRSPFLLHRCRGYAKREGLLEFKDSLYLSTASPRPGLTAFEYFLGDNW